MLGQRCASTTPLDYTGTDRPGSANRHANSAAASDTRLLPRAPTLPNHHHHHNNSARHPRLGWALPVAAASSLHRSWLLLSVVCLFLGRACRIFPDRRQDQRRAVAQSAQSARPPPARSFSFHFSHRRAGSASGPDSPILPPHRRLILAPAAASSATATKCHCIAALPLAADSSRFHKALAWPQRQTKLQAILAQLVGLSLLSLFLPRPVLLLPLLLLLLSTACPSTITPTHTPTAPPLSPAAEAVSAAAPLISFPRLLTQHPPILRTRSRRRRPLRTTHPSPWRPRQSPPPREGRLRRPPPPPLPPPPRWTTRSLLSAPPSLRSATAPPTLFSGPCDASRPHVSGTRPIPRRAALSLPPPLPPRKVPRVSRPSGRLTCSLLLLLLPLSLPRLAGGRRPRHHRPQSLSPIRLSTTPTPLPTTTPLAPEPATIRC